MDDAIVASEPINFTVSVVLFQNILDPGTEISLSLMERDGVATGIHIMTLYYHAPSLASSPDHSQFAHRSILVCNNIENWEWPGDNTYMFLQQRILFIYSQMLSHYIMHV